jgi:small ligand-binding sensory domain FIST
MEFRETLSVERDPDLLIEDLCSHSGERFVGRPPDLGFLFFSPHHTPHIDRIQAEVTARTGVRILLGCTGESIIGGGREVEGGPSATLWLASMPGVGIRTFRLRCEQTPDGFCFPCEPEDISETVGPDSSVILLGEPFTMPVDAYLRRFNEDCPGTAVIGGMASGAANPGENVLLIDGAVMRSGAVGIVLTGRLRLRTVVSQGCRPIGRRLVITECDRNAIVKMGGKSALRCVQEMFGELSTEERLLFEKAPHIGVVMKENQASFGHGDFLIRNVMGVDPAVGALFVGDQVRRGQTVQFHVRDGRAATEDLSALLERERKDEWDGAQPRGGLVFSCNGRGRRMFEEPDQDIGTIRDAFGEIPFSGFFAQGEVGPVGEKNHLHGFTACVALFGEP